MSILQKHIREMKAKGVKVIVMGTPEERAFDAEEAKQVFKAHLFTPEGKRDMLEILPVMKHLKNTIADDDDPVTKHIVVKNLPAIIQKDLHLIKIAPLGMIINCHRNAGLVEKTFGIERVTGFNVTGCPCGKRYIYECHSVNITHDGKFIDTTKDFAGETEKYFIEVDFTKHGGAKNIKNTTVGGRLCKCKGYDYKWALKHPQMECMTEQDFVDSYFTRQ